MSSSKISNPNLSEGPIECLCNSCLRVSRIDNYPEDGVALCAHCGDDVCWCDSCTETLSKLRAGIRNNTELGLQGSLAEWTWNETDGWKKIHYSAT